MRVFCLVCFFGNRIVMKSFGVIVDFLSFDFIGRFFGIFWVNLGIDLDGYVIIMKNLFKIVKILNNIKFVLNYKIIYLVKIFFI